MLLKYTRLVSWYFEPSQPLGIISGLTLQYILRTTDKDLSPHMLFQQGRQLIHLTPPSIIKHMLMKTRYDYLYLVLGAWGGICITDLMVLCLVGNTWWRAWKNEGFLPLRASHPTPHFKQFNKVSSLVSLLMCTFVSVCACVCVCVCEIIGVEKYC